VTDLVVQAPAIGTAELKSIVALAGARGLLEIDGGAQQAYRLPRIQSRSEVARFCAAAEFDYAFVPDEWTRDRVRVVALDMDSTLIAIECIDEIADLLGIKPEVAAITARAMRGEIEFRESLVRRVALLEGLPASALDRIYSERLRLSPGAERMLAGFKAFGARTMLVSSGFTYFTDRLRARLDFDESVANVLEIADGALTGRICGAIVDEQTKAQRLAAMRARYAGDGGLVVAIGDGANDLPMLEQADLSVAYRAKPIVRERATCAVDYCGLDAVLNLFA
jgi:phosphoserine phosphatase